MKRCKHIEADGFHHCGSYAFNLYNEGINQGKYCDRHYWQDQAKKARADEREECAKVCDNYDDEYDVHTRQTVEGISLQIRARSNT
jgi:hypothetical protein